MLLGIVKIKTTLYWYWLACIQIKWCYRCCFINPIDWEWRTLNSKLFSESPYLPWRVLARVRTLALTLFKFWLFMGQRMRSKNSIMHARDGHKNSIRPPLHGVTGVPEGHTSDLSGHKKTFCVQMTAYCVHIWQVMSEWLQVAHEWARNLAKSPENLLE